MISQKELEERIGSQKQKKGIYCFAQEFADEICKWFGTYKEMGLWTKKAKEDYPLLKEKFDYVKSKGIKDARYLLACTRRPV